MFQLTNHILTTAAKLTNKCTEVSAKTKKKSFKTPPEISAASKAKALANSKFLEASSRNEPEIEDIEDNYRKEKAKYQYLVRKYNTEKEIVRDQAMLNLLTKDPSKVFKNIKAQKKSENKMIKSLKVGDKVYSDENVADGFFDSISSLKTLPPITSTSFKAFA